MFARTRFVVLVECDDTIDLYQSQTKNLQPSWCMRRCIQHQAPVQYDAKTLCPNII